MSTSETFGDTLIFDTNSTPVAQPSVGAAPSPQIKGSSKGSSPGSSKGTLPKCNVHDPPWPTIIISVIGAILLMYTAVAPNLDINRRLFGVMLILLWCAMWALILWVLWKECHRPTTWWLLFIPVILVLIFFVLVIIVNAGSSI